MSIVLSMAIFFVVVTMVFVTITLLFPESMGITGKRAKKIIEQQQEQDPEKKKHDDETKP
ncbi:DUF1418 family protein [Bdellovibrio sp. NC01]|uniref:DUF1418 family protein n=1 Tax=Bdellovibrio sp. NC01 TaxID=2220073 RepID=UPI00115801F0|nr:DUF1418 family protein [Bdellovibrio sp. NC01]